MLAAFKRILVEGISVRGAEEVARQVKSEIQEKEPQRKTAKLHVPELDAIADSYKARRSLDDVKVDQTSKQARIVIIKKGDPNETTPFLKSLLESM
jgi:hypothetical protein